MLTFFFQAFKGWKDPPVTPVMQLYFRRSMDGRTPPSPRSCSYISGVQWMEGPPSYPCDAAIFQAFNGWKDPPVTPVKQLYFRRSMDGRTPQSPP